MVYGWNRLCPPKKMSDPSIFNKLILNDIWGDYPTCLLCEANAIEFHHCYGRGGKKRRLVHSSVFNASPLCRKCHARGDIKAYSQELLEKVVTAVGKSNYIMDDKDAVFLHLYRP